MRCQASTPETVSAEAGKLVRQRGFTLVEILVMLVILAIIAVITVANMQRALTKSRTNRGLRTIASTIDFARAEALKRRSPVGVVFGKSMTVFEDWDGAASNGIFDSPGDPLVMTNDVDETLTFNDSEPVGDLDAKTLLTTVVYSSDGSLSAPAGGGASYVEDVKGNVFRIKVNAVTGAARTEKFDGSGWSARREEWQWAY